MAVTWDVLMVDWTVVTRAVVRAVQRVAVVVAATAVMLVDGMELMKLESLMAGH